MLNNGKTDVLIVGAGPIGLFAALVLTRRGVKVAVVEEQWRGASRSYALGLHPQTLRLFREYGFAEEVVRRGHRVETVGLYDHSGRRKEFPVAELTSFPYVLVLPQRALEEVLGNELQKSGCEVAWSHRLANIEEQNDCVRAKVERLPKKSTDYSAARSEWVVDEILQVEAEYLIGADGHNSTVRQLANITFPERGSPSVFDVFEFETSSEAGSELQLVLDVKTTSVMWPMANGRFRWSFEIAGPTERVDPRFKSRLLAQLPDERHPHAAEDELLRLIRDRAPWFNPQITELDWSATVRFERRLANTFGRDRIWLVGDAAHLALPIGIQSMNIGFREAKKLGRALEAILHKKGTEELLTVFDNGRLAEWNLLLSRKTVPIVEMGTDEWVAARAARISQCLPASGRDLIRLLEKLGLQFSND